MITEILREDGAGIARAAEIINAGGLVAFPTETVYGLGADAKNDAAVKKIYLAKGRPSNNPLIIHIARPSDAKNYIAADRRFDALAEAFMPGAITVIAKSLCNVAPTVTAGLDSLAVRCPSHSTARALIEAAGTPVAAPSANLSGSPSPTRAADVIADMNGRIDAVIDGRECEVGVESTIVKLTDSGAILLRPGGITLDMLRAVLGEVAVSEAVTGKLPEGARPESPGMMYKHYAPKTPLTLVGGDDNKRIEFMQERLSHGSAVLCYDGELRGKNVLSLGAREDRAEQARRLFSLLREADRLGACEIFAPLPPDSDMGLALLNRMLRAAAYKIIQV